MSGRSYAWGSLRWYERRMEHFEYMELYLDTKRGKRALHNYTLDTLFPQTAHDSRVAWVHLGRRSYDRVG